MRENSILDVSNLTLFVEVRVALLSGEIYLNRNRIMIYNVRDRYNLIRSLAQGRCFHKGTFGVVEMFFRPNFCANCGEKIERAEWGVWTSRRFCYVCESEYKGHDLIPRFVVGVGIAIGVFGFGSYLKSGPTTPHPAATIKQPRRIAGQGVPEKKPSNVEIAGDQRAIEQPQAGPAAVKGPIQQPIEQSAPSAAIVKPVVAEQGYFCGAETKKGTPCSRRVKGNVRCFQHQGMQAMLAAEKLRIN